LTRLRVSAIMCSVGPESPAELGYSVRVRESRIARLPHVCWAPDYRARFERCDSWSSSRTGGSIP
jgi:hypothetical protein